MKKALLLLPIAVLLAACGEGSSSSVGDSVGESVTESVVTSIGESVVTSVGESVVTSVGGLDSDGLFAAIMAAQEASGYTIVGSFTNSMSTSFSGTENGTCTVYTNSMVRCTGTETQGTNFTWQYESQLFKDSSNAYFIYDDKSDSEYSYKYTYAISDVNFVAFDFVEYFADSIDDFAISGDKASITFTEVETDDEYGFEGKYELTIADGKVSSMKETIKYLEGSKTVYNSTSTLNFAYATKTAFTGTVFNPANFVEAE